jgi:potassium efflux system protein
MEFFIEGTMLRFMTHLPLVILFLAGFSITHGQTPAVTGPTNAASASTNAPAATPPVSAIALPEVIAQAQTVTGQLQDDQNNLTTDTTVQTVNADLSSRTDKIDERVDDDKELLQGNPSLSSLQSSQAEWQSFLSDLNSSAKLLSNRATQIDKQLTQLSQLQLTWQATLASVKGTVAPVERVQAVLGVINDTTKVAKAAQTEIFSAQDRVAKQETEIKNNLTAITKAQATARTELFHQNRPPLWNVEATSQVGAGIIAEEKVSLSTQLGMLRTYFQNKIPAVLIHILILAFLVLGFFWLRKTIHIEAQKTTPLARAAQVFDVPVATGVLLALLAGLWVYPHAPRLFRAIISAFALVPAVIIIRRLIEPPLFPILYATVIACLVDQLRYVLMPAGILSRFLFIFELLAVSIFLLTALHSKHLSTSRELTNRLERIIRLYLHCVFFGLLFAGIANVLGYVHLGFLIGDSTLNSSYLAVIFYAAVRILDALAIAALNIRPLSLLGMVRRHHDLLYANISTFLRWLAFALWILAALQLFTIRNPLWHGAHHLLTKDFAWGSLKFQLGFILAFPLTVWASFLLSRFVRFCLEEEVFPHLNLARGIPYAASTMVHYAILVVGFYLAAKAAGADLTQFSFLAGAFGVGLGFGLQNILNNFVSGIILLFERPIKVGDVIQMDATTMGKVERIGIRASVIMLTNGSELIVPNGNLISNPVTNWTLSNCERLIEIPVTITSKVDPQHVLALLNRTASANSHVLRNPAPQALLGSFTGTALTFRLRAWIDSAEDWMQITSDLSLAVNQALAQESITMG